MIEPRPPARVFIYEDACFDRVRLSTIVREAECEVLGRREGSDLAEALDSLTPAPDLMLLPVGSGDDGILEAVRTRHWLRVTPILAIASIDPAELDLWRLRGLGVVGLIDARATADHVHFRVAEVIQARGCPRQARAPCCFLVDLEAEGTVSREYALSLSLGGIGLACARSLEPNTPVKLRFALIGAGGRSIEVEGRVVRRTSHADARDEVGIVFLAMPQDVRDALDHEVRSLLLASGLHFGRELAPDCRLADGQPLPSQDPG